MNTWEWKDRNRAPDLSQEDCDKTHPGFTVTCRSCNSTRVFFTNDISFSPTSGSWGSCNFTCCDCGTETELVSG